MDGSLKREITVRANGIDQAFLLIVSELWIVRTATNVIIIHLCNSMRITDPFTSISESPNPSFMLAAKIGLVVVLEEYGRSFGSDLFAIFHRAVELVGWWLFAVAVVGLHEFNILFVADPIGCWDIAEEAK